MRVGTVKPVLFIVGMALGHMGRSLMIARALEARAPVKIHFACLSGHPHYERLLLEHTYPVTPLPLLNPANNGAAGADRLEQLIAELQPRLVYCDLNPLPPLLLVRFPEIPRVFLVDAYETRLGSDVTVQDHMWAQYGVEWNRLREARGLQPIEDPRSLFDADRVLLPDPPAIIGIRAELLAPGYIPVGPCIWDPPTPLPAELEDARDLLVLSMGSTGMSSLPLDAVRHIADLVGASRVIRIGSFDPGYGKDVASYQWLPGSQVMPRCKFVLTQGGAGSTYQALRAGVPVACVPAHRNHVALAHRLQKLEAGILLFQETWRQQLNDEPLDMNRLQAGARALSAEMSDVNGPGNAAEAMLELVR
jgi:UDP:flavonoid glycosyltransferase YjiC (YdhE family)